MATAYSEVYNWVLPDLPMAPLPLVLNAIRDSVIELCEKALIYRQELQEILVLGPTSTTTTAASALGALTITVDDTTDFVDGGTLTVELDDGTLWRGHVSGTPAAGVVTLDGALNQAVESGAAVTRLEYLYTLTLPTGTAIAKALQAWLNDTPIAPISTDDLDTEFNPTTFNWVGTSWRTDIGVPSSFYLQDDGTVGLALAPDATGNLRINAALKPTRVSTTFPTWIFERYVETIAHGAKGRIMKIPKKPYTDLVMAAYHDKEFLGLIGEARIRATRAATRAPLRTHTVFGLR
jgi:hypothetical protein